MRNIVITTLILLSTSSLFAENQRTFNTALKVSTLGVGFDISTPINDKISARFNLNGASYTDTQEDGDNEYEGTLELLTAGILVDYYPFENNFRLSTGAYYNGNGFTGSIYPTNKTLISINENEYTTADIVSLDSKITFDTVAPYFGIGWGNDANDKGWGFTFDLGAMYHGVGKANLTANVLNMNLENQIASDLVLEEENVNEELKKFKFYPVVSLGVNYTF